MKLPRVPPTAAGVTSGRGQGADPSGPPADRGEMPEAGAIWRRRHYHRPPPGLPSRA